MSHAQNHRLAIIVPVQDRGDALSAELRALTAELEDEDIMVVVDDGSKDESGHIIDAFADGRPNVRVVRFRDRAFYHGAWRTVMDAFQADYVYVYDFHYALIPGSLRSLMRAAVANPSVPVIFGDVLEHDRSERVVNVVPAPGWSEAETADSQRFMKEYLTTASPLYPHAHAAITKFTVLSATGLFQEELDSFSPLFTFIAAGLAGGVHYEPGPVVLLKDSSPVTYTRYSTNSLRQIDFAHRAAYLMKTEAFSDLIPAEFADVWRERAVREIVNREAAYVSSGFLSAKKAVEAIARESSLLTRAIVGVAQFASGVARRFMVSWSRFRMSRYRPDLSCYIAIKPRFSFGKNWHRFVKENFNDERLEIAQKDLLWFLDVPNLEGKRFLDIGCGSGLMSLAAIKAGAEFVEAFDYDTYSVKASTKLREKEGNPPNWSICQGSILDPEFVRTLTPADIVYSWGVLHHTGSMWEAIRNTSTLIKPGGRMYIAIYTKWPGSDDAIRLKVRYNQASWLGKQIIQYRFVRSYFPAWSDLFSRPKHFFERLKERYVFITGYKRLRGMHYMADIRDWLGGYPYEDSTVEELVWFCEKECSLKLLRVDPRGGNRCSLYLFERAAEA